MGTPRVFAGFELLFLIGLLSFKEESGLMYSSSASSIRGFSVSFTY